jgi:hypothetical protein
VPSAADADRRSQILDWSLICHEAIASLARVRAMASRRRTLERGHAGLDLDRAMDIHVANADAMPLGCYRANQVTG